MRVRRLHVSLGIAVFLLTVANLAPTVHAAEPSDAIAQIRSASSSYVEALNQGDPEGIAGFWTPQGTFVDANNNTHLAQELARQEFSRDADPQEQSKAEPHQSTVRLITPNVGLEQGCVGATGKDQTANSAASYLAVWVKSDGRWLLDYLKEFQIAPEPTEGRLAELAWMVGQWESNSDGINARLTVSWSDQRRYLIQEFTVQLPDQSELRGEQRITWDASKKQLRSWLFRSDGGFGEGVWTHEGDAWVVKKSEVLPNGEKAATVNLWVHDNPESCWFKSLHAKVDDQPAEDLVLQFRRTVSP